MEDPLVYTDKQGLSLKPAGPKDGNFTVSISGSVIEILDHLSNNQNLLPAPPSRKIHITTGGGNDIIHIISNGQLQEEFFVNIDAGGGNKLIVGTQDPMIKLQVEHADENDLILPDNLPGTYECYEKKIQQWNETNRNPDGLWKSIKRRLVYFFGRDLKFRRPFIFEERIRRGLCSLHLHKVDQAPLKNNYFTTRQQVDELEAIARPGDILLRYQDGYPFDRYFVGVWQHAGLYRKRGQVIDAMGNGTYLRTMDAFAEADGILLLRINGVSKEQVQQALAYAFEQIGKWYSVDFDDNIAEQYCSGLIVNAYKFAGVLEAGYRRGESIHPDDLLKLPGVEIIWTNRPDLLKRTGIQKPFNKANNRPQFFKHKKLTVAGCQK